MPAEKVSLCGLSGVQETVLGSPNFRLDVLDQFFAEHCPKHRSTNTNNRRLRK
jgi:hypothetical protein